MNAELTERQQRELEYHRDRAKEYQHVLLRPISWDVLQEPSRRWWNAYWQMYAYLLACNLEESVCWWLAAASEKMRCAFQNSAQT